MPLTDTILQDIRVGARTLARRPGFATVAILTLALGIGANTAIFSVTSAVLLAPLPYRDIERRVEIWSKWKDFDKTWLSPAEVLDYRQRAQTLDEVAAWGSGQVNLTGEGEPERVGSGRVTANAFAVLGADPILGRAFTAEEEAPNGPNVVVLSYDLWQRRFAGDPRIAGRTLDIDGTAHAIVGVMPRGFKLPTDFTEDAAEPTQLWRPLALNPEIRGSHGLYGAGLLAPGATAASAAAELKSITANMTREGLYPPAMQFEAFAVALEEEIVGPIRPALLLLAGAVGFLLLIACANVANLLLARAEARQREMAVRTALGAGRGRLARQLLTESLVLAAVSGGVGLALGWAGVRVLAWWNPTTVPRADLSRIDGAVLVFTAVVALATSVVFGLAPIVRTIRRPPIDALKEGALSTTAGGRRLRFRNLLVVAEFALAVVLLIGAGLMLRSLWALQQIDIGMDPDKVLTARVNLPGTRYDTPEKVIAFYEQLLERVRRLPAVTHAGAIRSLPLASTIGDWSLDIEGFVETPGNSPKGDWQVATPGALEAMGERLLRGRLFTVADSSDALQVALVNETMARKYWPGQDPLGRRMRQGSPERPWITIVGIVGDVRHNGITGIIKEKFYRPHAQFHRSAGNPIPGMTLVVKSASDPLALVAPIKAEVAAMDRSLPVANVRTLDEVVAASMATPRFTGFLLALFAALALTLAAVGVYGVLSYLVSQRTREIGIRLALGAARGEVLRMVLKSGLAMALAGVAVGVYVAYVLTRLMETQLHGVTPTDPVTFVAVPATLALVALAAGSIPAWRATRVNPVKTLKAE